MNKYLQRFGYFKEPILHNVVDPQLNIIVVIPAYDEPNLITSLDSLKESFKLFTGKIEVIVVLNFPVYAEKEVKQRLHLQSELLRSKELKSMGFPIHIIEAFDLPKKKAGVGLARKIGMDEAALRLLKTESRDGIICCFDADCFCDINYFTAVHSAFANTDTHAISIKFEHPLKESDSNLNAIILYELHLRLYLQFQRDIGLPFAFHTVGSSMAVRASKYMALGGMNTRKAGEDFYFLQKFIAQGYCMDCNSTTVYPSTRVSNRVPFGTGRAMGTMQSYEECSYSTYNPISFKLLRPLLAKIDLLYDPYSNWEDGLTRNVLLYLRKSGFYEKLDELRSNVSSILAFRKRFFQRFDAFWFMKYLHHMRDHGLEDQDVMQVAKDYLGQSIDDDPKSLLMSMRFRNNSPWRSV